MRKMPPIGLMLSIALMVFSWSVSAQTNCTPGTACNDDNPCTINDVFDDNCDCIGTLQDTGIDSDGDGTSDCFDLCPNDPDKIFPGACGCGESEIDTDGDETPDCFDLCPNDPNKIFAGVCGCGEVEEDNDGDTIFDCIDLCPNSTLNVDSDGDGVCDEFDECPFGDDNVDDDNNGIPDACENCNPSVGTACDDGNICTVDDQIVADCECLGRELDSDGDGICDAEDICPGGDDTMDDDNDGIPNFCDTDDCENPEGTPCNDGNNCTVNDSFNADCMCVGTFSDSDGDGVCDVEDICNGGNDNMDSDGDGIPDFCDDCDVIPGTFCDDNNDCTVGDFFDADCNCSGVFMDTDGDGVCDAEDICMGGNDNMDSDGDGIPDFCDTEDCPFEEGAACNDGSACTVNDAIDADCNCVGTFADSDGDGVCDANDVCNGGDDNEDEDGDGIPDFCDTEDCPFEGGAACNDGNVCTVNDAIDADCNCVGTFQDSDGDGVCDANDICNGGDDNEDEDGDGIPDFCDTEDCPFEEGAACNDGNVCTVNDVIDADCNCVGTFQDSDGDGVCDANDVCNGGDDNEDEDGDGIPDFCDTEDCPFEEGAACNDGNVCTVNDAIDSDCNCVGTFQDSDGDGVCDANDICNGGDDNEDEDGDGIPDFCDTEDCPFEEGAACNDGNACTVNDAIDSDCNCVGTFADSDGDGICDANDICNGGDDNEDEDGDGIPDFCDTIDCPFTLGTPCDDQNVCTVNDAYNSNCECEGIYLDSDLDGVCDAEDICEGGDDYMDNNGNGIPDFCDFCTNCSTSFTVQCLDEITLTLANNQSEINFSPPFPEFQLEGCPSCENEEVIEDFIYLGMFQGHRYYVSEGINNWADAKWIAGENKGYLVVIGSAAENAFLTENINHRMSISSAYIGLQDLAEEGNLVWMNGESLDYTNWNNPVDEMNGNSRNVGRWLNNGKWDMEYQNANRHFIMEVPCVNIRQMAGPADGIFREGTHTLRFEATTPCGDIANCSYQVNVMREQSPFIIPEANILRFYALKRPNFVELEWATNQGFNTHHFELERSTDNVNFEIIANRVNLDNTNELMAYEFIDERPAKGANFYRLRQVFHNGTFFLSTVQKIVMGYDIEEVFVFPNPTDGKLFLNLKGLENQKAVVKIYNVYGQQMQEQSIETIPKRPIEIDAESFEDGLYLMTVEIDNYRLIVERFVIGD